MRNSTTWPLNFVEIKHQRKENKRKRVWTKKRQIFEETFRRSMWRVLNHFFSATRHGVDFMIFYQTVMSISWRSKSFFSQSNRIWSWKIIDCFVFNGKFKRFSIKEWKYLKRKRTQEENSNCSPGRIWNPMNYRVEFELHQWRSNFFSLRTIIDTLILDDKWRRIGDIPVCHRQRTILKILENTMIGR